VDKLFDRYNTVDFKPTDGGNMKRFVQLFVILFATVAFAETTMVSLKSAMQDMSSALKTITVQANDTSKNADSADLAAKFVTAAQQAKTVYPASASSDESKAQYTQMLDGVIATGQQLQAAFASNDNTQAVSLLNQLVQEKKDGHTQFKH
jgi:hypothetical protein